MDPNQEIEDSAKKHTDPNRTLHLLYVPFTGLGMYGGFRGNRWLRNRIKIFKQFVVLSLEAQTNQNFKLWISWRPEEKNNAIVKEFQEYLNWTKIETIHTFHGVCFWDDKYPEEQAKIRLMQALHGSIGDIMNATDDKEYDYILMTIQPSDDCYHKETIEVIQRFFKETDYQAFGFSKGYVMNYQTLELAEWNPQTNPPFFTIKFPRAYFIDPTKHASYTGPYKSHEFVPQFLKYATSDDRGFIVGTHYENISTVFNHPYTKPLQGIFPDTVLKEFGLGGVPPLVIPISIRKKILRRLPHPVQKKLRYIFGERIWNNVYSWLRN